MPIPDDATPAELPPYLSPAQVGKACDMSRRAAKHLLRAVGILQLRESGRWYVCTEALRERLPDVFERVRRYVPPQADGEEGEP